MRTHTPHLLLTLLLATAIALTSACGTDASTAGADGTQPSTGEGDTTGNDSESDSSEDPTEDDASGPNPGTDVVDTPTPAGCDAEESATLQAMNWGEVLGGCSESCLGEGATDVEGCGAECVAEATGIGETCSACFGDFLACTLTECAAVSEDPGAPAPPCPGDEAACQECVSTQCEPLLLSCIGMSTQDTAGCTNDADQAIIMSSLGTMFETCAPDCLEASNPGACLEVCTMEIGLSGGCGMCFYNYGECTVTSCGDLCSPETIGDPACQQCIDASCGAAFAGCAGFQITGGPSCTNPSDTALLDNAEDPVDACGGQCAGEADPLGCMTTCLADAGFSEDCSECLGVFSTCVGSNCANECSGNAEGCDACISASCMDEAGACFGTGQEAPPGDEIMCGGDQDQAVLEVDAQIAQTCAMTCSGDSDPGACITSCLTDGGLTEGCSNCVSWMLGCVFENCNDECTDPNQAEACNACTATSCAEASAACFGDSGGSTTGPTDPGDEGMCSMADSSIMMADKPDEICGMQCFAAPEQAQCISDCMSDMGVSQQCSDCMADLLVCVMDSCMMVCMDQGPDCEECIDTNCATQSDACYANDSGGGGGNHP